MSNNDEYEDLGPMFVAKHIENKELTIMLYDLESQLKLKNPNYLSIIIQAGAILRAFLYYNSMPEGDRTIEAYDRIMIICCKELKLELGSGL